MRPVMEVEPSCSSDLSGPLIKTIDLYRIMQRDGRVYLFITPHVL